jgi:prepilin-type N-terminal cleavage/methylation domain-containing protein
MMPTLVTLLIDEDVQLNNKHTIKLTHANGYTLLELLIVLVLMSLFMGLATPKLAQMYDSVSFSIERDDVLFQLESLPFAVYQRGESYKLLELGTTSSSEVISLPEGWKLDDNETTNVVYNSLGFCSGGEATFFKDDRQLRVKLEPPSCRPIVL